MDAALKYQAFFFDFDGVLADSVEIKTKAFAKLFEPYGKDIVRRVMTHHRAHGGVTRKDKFRYYYKEFLNSPLNEKEVERLCQKFSSLVVDTVVSSPEIPGAENFLKKWYERLPCFVISATPDEEIVTIVKQRGFKNYFQEILGSSRTKKKHMEIILKKYNLTPQKCIFFGDAETDYLAAMAHNVIFIGIVPGSHAPLLHVAPEIMWARNFIELNLDG